VAKQQIQQWADSVETSLTQVFTISSVLDFIQTSRYSHILNMDTSSPRVFPTVYAELTRQAQRLTELANEIEEETQIFAAASGQPIVLDTNAVLRTKSFVTLDWATLVGGQEARVILPLRVVEELDAKKYGDNEEFRRVVRRLLPKVDDLLDAAGGRTATLTSTLTIEILVPPGPRQKPSDADEEILEVCVQLHTFTGRPVTLVTLDTAMRTRARARGLHPVRPPASFLKGSEQRWQEEANLPESD